MKKSFIFGLILSQMVLAGPLTPSNTHRTQPWPSISLPQIFSALGASLSKLITPQQLPSFQENKAAWLGIAGLTTLIGAFSYRWWANKPKNNLSQNRHELRGEPRTPSRSELQGIEPKGNKAKRPCTKFSELLSLNSSLPKVLMARQLTPSIPTDTEAQKLSTPNNTQALIPTTNVASLSPSIASGNSTSANNSSSSSSSSYASSTNSQEINVHLLTNSTNESSYLCTNYIKKQAIIDQIIAVFAANANRTTLSNLESIEEISTGNLWHQGHKEYKVFIRNDNTSFRISINQRSGHSSLQILDSLYSTV